MTFNEIIKSMTEKLTGNYDKDICFIIDESYKYKEHKDFLKIMEAIGGLTYDLLPDNEKREIQEFPDDYINLWRKKTDQVKKRIMQIKSINKEWITELKKEDPKLHYLMYEPFVDYWKEKYRIVWCNLEPGGIPPNNEEKLSEDTYRYWLETKGVAPTINKTSLFIYCLIEKLKGNDINEKQKDSIKNNYDELMKYVRKITYMNILKDCGDPNFNEDFFKEFFAGEKGKKDKERTKYFIEALEPDIFIVTGRGKEIIQELYKNKFDEKHSFVSDNKTLFINLGHPRGGWLEQDWLNSYIYKNVNMINDNLIRYKLEK